MLQVHFDDVFFVAIAMAVIERARLGVWEFGAFGAKVLIQFDLAVKQLNLGWKNCSVVTCCAFNSKN